AKPLLDTPAGFVTLEDGTHYRVPGATFKAMSADGAVLMVRRHDNDTHSDLAFWADALAREMTDGQGYELIGTAEASTRAGRKGRLLQLRGTMNDVMYRYDVAVFVDGDHIY